jgi:hypothetical protein
MESKEAEGPRESKEAEEPKESTTAEDPVVPRREDSVTGVPPGDSLEIRLGAAHVLTVQAFLDARSGLGMAIEAQGGPSASLQQGEESCSSHSPSSTAPVAGSASTSETPPSK